jgi:uncharacterized protein DUF4304
MKSGRTGHAGWEDAAVEDAQTVFKAWTKDALAPALRGMGFRGSGQVFTLPDEECWALLGIQKSTSSTSELLKFTLNFSVANRHLWNGAGDRPEQHDPCLPTTYANTHTDKPEARNGNGQCVTR